MIKTSPLPALLGALALAVPAANASLMLYSSTFGGSSGDPLNGAAVNTSGATAAQHTQYGTSATATWAAHSSFKADGSYVHPGAGTRVSGTLPFVPQNGYIYTLTMTTDYAVSAGNSDWFATGFFMQPGYSGMMHTDNGATVFALTRPGSGNANGDQVAHYNLLGGSGPVGAPSTSEDTTAPTTLKLVLNTTGGTGNWSATYYVGNDLLATVADLNAVDIESVGIGATFEAATASPGRFQSFELSVAGDEIILCSSTFGGSSGTDLNGTAVNTSGATAAQHTQYGTSATATWSAASSLKADGSFVFTGNTAANLANSGSGTLPFIPQNGYVYTVSMTTDLSVATTLSNWFATGFFMQPNYPGKVNAPNGATVWALTRPGNANSNGDQVAHYNLVGGAGPIGVPSASEDTTAPSTLKIVLDTTAGTGNWSATYYVGNDVLATVADLNAVDIESVGIGVTFDGATASPGKFLSFELSVMNTLATWISGKIGVNGQTAVNQDPDGDGIDNGVENFFGTEPGVFSQGLQAAGVSGSIFTFTHPVNATPASNLTATYRWSKDLVTFTPGGGTHDGTTVTITPGTPSGGFVTLTAEASGTPTSKLFIDVQVTQP